MVTEDSEEEEEFEEEEAEELKYIAGDTYVYLHFFSQLFIENYLNIPLFYI